MPNARPAGDFQSEERLKFGCHDFLNSQPIVHPLKEGRVSAPFDTVFAPPARLADMLKAGELDIAFIPAVEYARIHGLRIAPGFSIAARGPVKTVLLFSRKRMEEVDTVVVDHRSRTSVSLLNVLLREFYGREASFSIVQNSGDLLKSREDAVLVIGDEAFSAPPELKSIDLAEEWFRHTGLPFVFALLCVAPGRDADVVIDALRKAKEAGKKSINEICRKFSARLGIAEHVCRDYLVNRIRYDLVPDDVKGLELFLELAQKHGAVHGWSPLRFYHPM